MFINIVDSLDHVTTAVGANFYQEYQLRYCMRLSAAQENINQASDYLSQIASGQSEAIELVSEFYENWIEPWQVPEFSCDSYHPFFLLKQEINPMIPKSYPNLRSRMRKRVDVL